MPMTPDEIELAQRLVACKGWEWKPGMQALYPPMPARRVASPATVFDLNHGHLRKGRIPDLHDPATAGCLLEMATWGDCRTDLQSDGCMWRVRVLQRNAVVAESFDQHLGVAVARVLLKVLGG